MLPAFPSLVAVITTASARASPVTMPVAETEATFGALLVQLTVRPVSSLPFASFRRVVSCNVRPTMTPPACGVTSTEATGAGGGVGSPPHAPSRAEAVRSTKRPIDAVVMRRPLGYGWPATRTGTVLLVLDPSPS